MASWGVTPAIALTALLMFSGCGWVRPWVAARSAECHHLCQESRSAREQGRTAEADSLLYAALRQRPQDHEARLHLADELWTSGRQLAAAEVLSRLVQDAPVDAYIPLRLAEMELEIGRTQAASEAVQAAFRIDPESPAVLRVKAVVEQRQGDTATALATYHRLLQILPDDLDAQILLAELHLKRGHPDRAAPLLRSVAEHSFVTAPQRLAAQRLLADSYIASERWNDAAECLSCVLQHCSDSNAEDWYRLATVQARCGQSHAALASAAASLRQRPDHLGALQLMQNLQTPAGPQPVMPAGFRAAEL